MGRVEEMALVGGHPAVDFVNTLGGLPGLADDEYLTCEQDFRTWCHRVGLIAGQHQPLTVDDGTFRDALRLRADVDQVLRAHLEGQHASTAAHTRLREHYVEAIGSSALRWDGSRYHLDWGIQARPRQLLWRLAASAIDLLTGDELDRLARCGRCRWLFVDASRSHTRRWCTMNSCGAITKMRRYRGTAE